MSFFPKILHNTSIDFVFDVPVSPSSTKGIFDSKKKFIFCILSIDSFVGINILFILMFSHDIPSRLYSFNYSIEGISIFLNILLLIFFYLLKFILKYYYIIIKSYHRIEINI